MVVAWVILWVWRAWRRPKRTTTLGRGLPGRRSWEPCPQCGSQDTTFAMNQITHIKNNRQNLDARFALLRATREWFWSQGFTEVETPAIVACPDQEPTFSLMQVAVHNENHEPHIGYLHTSPEYAMKKMLAAGYDKIFFLGKVFRDAESFGGTHNPEFTMIEWYRNNADYRALMDDIENLLKAVAPKKSFMVTRVHMRDLWREHVGVNLDDYLSRETMLELCRGRGFNPNEDEAYESLFYRIFLNEIEPKLAGMGVVFVHHYPLPMAALSRPSATDQGYAERVEAYVDAVELANGFSELTDSVEQRRRFEHEQSTRIAQGKQVFPIDEDLVEAVGRMPQSAGIALGFDRLAQIVTGCKNIDDVLVLPASKLF